MDLCQLTVNLDKQLVVTHDMALGSGTSSVHLIIKGSDHPYSTPMKFACTEDESELSIDGNYRKGSERRVSQG